MEEVKEKQDNRTRILECALDLFYAKGYEGVGVQEIVTKAGISKPTLYYYYKSKYGLLESVLEEFVPHYIDSLCEAKNSGEGLEDCLRRVARVYINNGIRYKKAFYLFLNLQYSPKESESHTAASKYSTQVYNVFRDLFVDNAKMIGNMNGRQEQFAMGFLGILNCYMLVYFERAENSDNEQTTIGDKEIYLLVHQFMHGIFS